VVKSRFGYRTPIPSISSSKGQTKAISYKDGINTFKDNDDVKVTEVVEAIDARFSKIGRYKTRRGADRYSVPIGEAVNAEIDATTGASTYTLNGSHALAQKLTAASAGRITRVDVNLQSTDDSAGVLLVEVYDDDSGVPGDLLCRSSIAPADIASTADYESAYFMKAPAISSADVLWVVIRGQNTKVGDYKITTTTDSSDALIRAFGEAGVWTAADYSANVKLYTSTDGGVKGVIRAYRPNGLKVTLMAYGSTVASVDAVTGATTTLKSDFEAAATNYRARMVQDAVYLVNGLEKPWKYDFTNWTELTDAPYIPSLIEEHKGLLFFNDTADKTRIFYSNFAEYDTYTSTDFIYVPAPKSYDALTAFAKLNGVLYLFANRNKFQLMGSDNDTFQLEEAASQRGTFSQESLVYDANFIYHADAEGIWQFNGTSERNLAEPFLEDYMAITNKDSIQLDVAQNRLYVFYSPAGTADNSQCFVINLQLGLYESLDKGTYIGRTFARYAQDDLFIQASNRVAALYYGELHTNFHHNLGDQLQFEVKTAYNHFDHPGNNKRIPKWRPQFPSQVGDYAIQVGYDLDGQNDPIFSDVELTGSGPRFDTGVLYDSGARFSGQRLIEPTSLHVPGTFKRVQRRYKHVAAREPVELDSEIMSLEIQRLI
jgi:hypothetical protein